MKRIKTQKNAFLNHNLLQTVPAGPEGILLQRWSFSYLKNKTRYYFFMNNNMSFANMLMGKIDGIFGGNYICTYFEFPGPCGW